MERFLDICLSSVALLVLLPLFLITAFILRFTGEREIFFLQERVGLDGKRFKIIKFATMLKNSPYIGSGTVTMHGDPRILPFGRILRRTKINELPQIINIIYGDMSFVGPRPLTNQTFGSYPEEIQELVVSVKPGLSGVGSIIFRGEEEIMKGSFASTDFYVKVIAPYKGELERWFIKNKSLVTYVSVVVITVWTVLYPSTRLAWKILKDLPKPPVELQAVLNYR